MTWTCAAIDHGVTVFPNEKIGPCCQINSSYLKPIAELSNPDRFADLKTQDCPPDHPCNKCSVAELYEYAGLNNIAVNPIVLTGPDYLALDVVPDELKSLALEKISLIESNYTVDKKVVQHIKDLINNNLNQNLFQQTISHILFLDNLRGEKLFELLPFRSIAVDNILRNYEYE